MKYHFKASTIPALWNPSTIMLGWSTKYLCMSINHLAENGFITLGHISTTSSTLSSSCLQIISPYQFWNCLFIKSFTGLFTLRSKGCSLSEQFAGKSVETRSNGRGNGCLQQQWGNLKGYRKRRKFRGVKVSCFWIVVWKLNYMVFAVLIYSSVKRK